MTTLRWSRRALTVTLAAAVATGVLTAGAVAVVVHGAAAASQPQAAAVSPAPVAVPTVAARTAAGGLAPWDAPLSVHAADGSLVDVSATGPDGPVTGSLQSDGTWQSTDTLVPLADYDVRATVRDTAGAQRVLSLAPRTSAATAVLHTSVAPGDDQVVGVGTPIVVWLDQPVSDPADRKAVESRLSVVASPAVTGGWRWLSDRELHYRPASFWSTGTKVSFAADLTRLPLSGGTWGSGRRTSHFTVGSAMVSTVDTAAHTMTVTRDGTVLRVLRASMGKPGHATRGGTHIVLEKFSNLVMDSATVGSPGEYKIKVDWAVRITNSGTFTHSAPWSVGEQGHRNVSHGCVNLSPADAKWFFDQSRRGDVVKVVNSPDGPRLSDAGDADWNVPFAQWSS